MGWPTRRFPMRLALLLSATLALPFATSAIHAEPPAPPVLVPPLAPAPGAAHVPGVIYQVHVLEATPRAARSLRLLSETRRTGEAASADPQALMRRIECWVRRGHVRAIQSPKVVSLPREK